MGGHVRTLTKTERLAALMEASLVAGRWASMTVTEREAANLVSLARVMGVRICKRGHPQFAPFCTETGRCRVCKLANERKWKREQRVRRRAQWQEAA